MYLLCDVLSLRGKILHCLPYLCECVRVCVCVCVKVEGNKNKVEGFSFLFAFWRQLYPFCVFSNCSLSMGLKNMATRVLAPVTETPRPRQAGPRARLLMIRQSHQIPFSHSVMSGSCNPMDCSLPGSSVHGILQGRILAWVAISYSRGSPQPGIEPPYLESPALAGRFFTNCTTWKTPYHGI